MNDTRRFSLAAWAQPLEWGFPAAVSARLLYLLWNSTPLDLKRFPDRTIGIAVLQDYDVRARSMFLVEGLIVTALVCGLWLLAWWWAAPHMNRGGSTNSSSRLRRLLAPAHYLGMFSIGAMVFQIPVPEWSAASSLALALAVYFVAAAVWIVTFRARLSLTHGLALASFSVMFGAFRLMAGRPLSLFFVGVAFATVGLAWTASHLLRDKITGTTSDSARLRSWLILALAPLLLLPALPELGQEVAYFELLQFNVAPEFAFVSWMCALALIAIAAMILAAALLLRPRRIRSSSWLLSRILLPLSMVVTVTICTLPRAGGAVNPDVHHWGEALLPLDQLLRFGSIPYIDIMPTHGLAANLGPLLHRIIYGCHAIDEFALGTSLAVAIGFLCTYFFLHHGFASPGLALLLPLMLQPVVQPSMGYAAPYYAVGLVVILVICRALSVWTTRAFVIAGFAVLGGALLRLDVAVGTGLIGSVLIATYAAYAWRDSRIRRALGFFAVLGGAASLYVLALLIRTGSLQRLKAFLVFSSLDFHVLYNVPRQFLSPLVSRYSSNLFLFLVFPLSMIAVLVVLLEVARLAAAMGSRGIPDDRRLFWRASIVIALGAYNVLVFDRGLQRFNEAMVGGGFLSQYNIGFSFLVILLAAQWFGIQRKGRALLWIVAIVLTVTAVPTQSAFARLPLDALSAPAAREISRPVRMNEFSARLYLTSELLSDWRTLRAYIDHAAPPGDTFVELGNGPLFHVAFGRRFPAFNIITFTAASEALQQAYLSGWNPARVPVVLVRGGEDWLNDIDTVPDAVRNYRLHEQLHKYYRRDCKAGPFVMYRSLQPEPAPASVASVDGEKTVAPSAPVIVTTAPISVGAGQEVMVTFEAQCHETAPTRVIFQSGENASVSAPVICGAPGFSRLDEWADYRVQSPLEFYGVISAIRIEAAGTGTIQVRNIRVTLGPKAAGLDQPLEKATYSVQWLPFIWGQYDPLHAATRQPVVRTAPEVPVDIRPGEAVRMRTNLPAAPASYIRVEAESPTDGSLVLNYAKSAIPLSTPKGFRFGVRGGRRAFYLIRASVQPYWYGDRSALVEIVLWNDSKVAIRVFGVAVQTGD